MVIGSGPIVIGQAAEFDYAGAQACRMLKKEGVNVVLINPNPATIMTDRSLADEIYLEPLTAETVKRIILKEKPDSLLAGLGGQTGLTLASKLAHEGFLQKHNVRLIGTNAEAIEKAEDRKLFKETMEEIGEPVIPSHIANTSDEALEAADRIGYPVIIRPAFTLGGAGGGIAYNETELDAVATTGLNASPINQILVEKYIYGWKEIEFETMRDNAGNAIAVCSMENFDPVGIHTGDSIVAAPTLTLSDKELQMLRSASMNIISALNIVGGCNCQFALDPHSQKYAVIEVNPRVSRSSALASKATGYPIAKVTTLIALGYNLDEITNDITGKTCACFEPALDYVVVKFPKWPFDKFSGASRKLGTQMKATGEVMAIAHSFEAALMKAIRGAEIKLDIIIGHDGQLTAHERQDRRLADEVLIALVRRVDRDAAVAEHRLGARGGDGQILVAVLERVADIPERAGHILILDLRVGQGSAAVRAPVDDAVALVDQALFIQLAKRLTHGLRAALIHGKAAAIPVAGHAERLLLLDDAVAVLLFPRPDALQKCITAEIVAGQTLFLAQHLLDLDLRGDAGVIRAGHPERGIALHALIAREDVLQRRVERVAHVQLTRNIRGRHYNGKRLFVRIGFAGKIAAAHPHVINLLLDLFGVVDLRKLFHGSPPLLHNQSIIAYGRCGNLQLIRSILHRLADFLLAHFCRSKFLIDIQLILAFLANVIAVSRSSFHCLTRLLDFLLDDGVLLFFGQICTLVLCLRLEGRQQQRQRCLAFCILRLRCSHHLLLNFIYLRHDNFLPYHFVGFIFRQSGHPICIGAAAASNNPMPDMPRQQCQCTIPTAVYPAVPARHTAHK